jgi:putative methyltransferase (TIGR04325 family)
MKQRSTREILAAIGGDSLNPKARKKALVKALLEAGPLPYLINLGKPIPGYRRFLNHCLPSWLKYRGVYASFEEARANAPKNVRLGFDHDEIAFAYKDYGVRPSDYPAAFWLREALRDGATVFDLGGSVGNLFYLWEDYFEYPGNVRWLICEVPAVARAGHRLAQEKGENRLRFTSRFEEADGSNCLLASGCLQLIETSIADTLRHLACPPQHLVLNRLPLHSRFECITLLNIRWAACPCRVFQRDRFIGELESLGYVVVDAWAVPDQSCWIPFYPEYSVESYTGLYLRRAKRKALAA